MVRYEEFGAHDVGGRIRFRVFVPGADDRSDGGGSAHIATIEAYGTFQAALTGQAWDLAQAVPLTPAPYAGGTLYEATTGSVPDTFHEYKYRVSFDDRDGTALASRIITDPCARYGVGESETPGWWWAAAARRRTR